MVKQCYAHCTTTQPKLQGVETGNLVGCVGRVPAGEDRLDHAELGFKEAT